MTITISGSGSIAGVNAFSISNVSFSSLSATTLSATTLNANTLYADGTLLANSGFGSTANTFGCRAWANFNTNITTIVIRASGNISSITDNGTGDYTINFTNAMPDANYAFLATSSDPNDDSVGPVAPGFKATTYTPSTTARRMETTFQGTSYDANYVYVAVFR